MPFRMNRWPAPPAAGLAVGQKLETINGPGEENADGWEGYGVVVEVNGDDVVVQWHHDGSREQFEAEMLVDFMVDEFEADYWRRKLGHCVED